MPPFPFSAGQAAAGAVLPPGACAVPTMAQAGQKDFVIEQWQAVFLPGRAPADLVQRLNTEINKALKDPGVVALADKLGIGLVGDAARHLAEVQKADSATWARVIRDGHIKAD